MYFDLTDDQLVFQGAIRQFCEDRFSSATVRSLADRGGVDPALWRELADMGLFGLRLPEDQGGAGLGWPDAAIIFEQLGRSLVPGPLVASHLAASRIDGVVEGSCVVGDVDLGSGLGSGDESGDALERPIVIEHLDALDTVVIVSDDGLRSLPRADIEAVAVSRPLDPLTPLHRVTRMGEGTPIGTAEDAARWRLEGALLTSAFQVGMAEAVLDQAVGYAKEREQFQRPIGSFQAIKHQLADSLIRADVAQAGVYAASVVLGAPSPDDDVVRSVATAKLVAGEAALENAKVSIQVNGAMGFTWELDVHLYLKRAYVLDTHYGSIDFHAAVMAAHL